jgi:methylamine--corrinoid protein Co-methyltransferase
MGSSTAILKTINKTRTGKRCTEKEWDFKRIPQAVKEVLKKYDLNGTCDLENPVNGDEELADRFFKAGYELALRLGLFCPETERIIGIDEEELERAWKKIPDRFDVGLGEEKVTIRARKPSDGVPPIFIGPLSLQVDEDLYVPIAQGILSSRLIDVHEGPSLSSVLGNPLLTDTPYETLAGIYEARLRKEAQWRAGRSGMGNCICASAATHLGYLASIQQYDYPQISLCLNPASMKINYTTLHKCVVAHEFGHYIRSESPTMIGGYSGGPEGSALVAIATDILQFAAVGAHLAGASTYDLRTTGNCGRHGLWAQTIANQAISRNSNILIMKTVNQTAGPFTDMFFYESIAGYVAASVSGLSATIGPRSAGGRCKNQITPIEAWFSAAVFKGSAGLSVDKANEILNEVLPKYEDQLKEPPDGVSFRECWDAEKVEPSKEYLDYYLEKRQYTIDLGIPLPGDGIYS